MCKHVAESETDFGSCDFVTLAGARLVSFSRALRTFSRCQSSLWLNRNPEVSECAFK